MWRMTPSNTHTHTHAHTHITLGGDVISHVVTCSLAGCDGVMDVTFVVDASESVIEDDPYLQPLHNWKRVVEFVKGVVTDLPVAGEDEETRTKVQVRREREKERQKQRQTERQRERGGRQTQPDSQRARQTDRQTDTHTHTHTHRGKTRTPDQGPCEREEGREERGVETVERQGGAQTGLERQRRGESTFLSPDFILPSIPSFTLPSSPPLVASLLPLFIPLSLSPSGSHLL